MKNLKLTAYLVAAAALPLIASASPPPHAPSVPEPSTIIGGALCLIPLGVAVVRGTFRSRK